MKTLQNNVETKNSASATQSSSSANALHLASATAFFSGPLPPADIFEKYERTLPGAADRILKIAEAEANHRRSLERSALIHNIWIAHLSQVFAFILGLAGLFSGVYCVAIGQPLAGTALAGASLVALVSAFLNGRK